MVLQTVIRTLVVDDEPPACEGVSRLLATDPEIRVIQECFDGRSAVQAIRELKPDLVFLDVQMPELDGFGVIRAVGAAHMPAVVFVTAFDDYAVSAFGVEAIDYVLKPFKDQRLFESVARAKRLLRRAAVEDAAAKLVEIVGPRATPADAGRPPRPASPDARIEIREPGRVSYVRSADIHWIEGADDYSRIHTKARGYLARMTMRSLESRLDAARFLRVHRSAIVNLSCVREVRRSRTDDDAVAVLFDGSVVPVARARCNALETALRGLTDDAEVRRAT